MWHMIPFMHFRSLKEDIVHENLGRPWKVLQALAFFTSLFYEYVTLPYSFWLQMIIFIN